MHTRAALTTCVKQTHSTYMPRASCGIKHPNTTDSTVITSPTNIAPLVPSCVWVKCETRHKLIPFARFKAIPTQHSRRLADHSSSSAPLHPHTRTCDQSLAQLSLHYCRPPSSHGGCAHTHKPKPSHPPSNARSLFSHGEWRHHCGMYSPMIDLSSSLLPTTSASSSSPSSLPCPAARLVSPK